MRALGWVGPDSGVGSTDQQGCLRDEEAPVAGSDLCICSDIISIGASGLQVVCVVEGGVRGVRGGDAQGGDDVVLSADFVCGEVAVSTVRKGSVGVVAGDGLGDACSRNIVT